MATLMSTIKKSSKSVTVPVDKITGEHIVEDIRFKKLIEKSQDGLTLLNKDMQVIYRSSSAEHINGWNVADRANYAMVDLIHPDDLEGVKKLLNEVLGKPGISKTCNFRSKHAKGHFIWLECAFTNFFHDTDINAIVCNFRDVSEKRNAEDLLQQTIKELYAYKYTLDESAIVAITDQKGIIKHVNENFCRISKYSEAELIGQDHSIINSGYHDKAFIRNLWVTIARGDIWKGELKNRASDGSHYWVDTTIVPFINENGKPYQYVAIRSDITERKLAQEKIIDSEHFIKTITDNLPAMIAYWTADLDCLFANKSYMAWFEKQPHEMLGINKRNLLDKKEFELHKKHIENVLIGKPQSFERTFIKNNGNKIYTHTQYLPDKDGKVIKGFYSLIYDITEIKLAEVELKKKTEQIQDILDNITDGFIALDQNMCYTYVNKQIGKMLGCDTESLIGKNIWKLFPDVVDSATYHAIVTAFNEKKYICNEDYYAPLNLWQENRVYPSGNGVSVFIRDITKTKQEEQHLKLLESVITNTTDAVLITEADQLDEPGPRIIYVNEAFTKMTGYSAEEVTGKNPRILQGPKSDKLELKRLSEAMHKGQSYEVTTVNYKKSGEEFWINFAVSPVTNDQGRYSHFIAIERDVTDRKNEEIQRNLLAEISQIFNNPIGLNETLYQVLEQLVNYGNFSMAEIWLINTDKNKVGLAAQFSQIDKMQVFFNESSEIKSFLKGEGLPGTVWETQSIQHWNCSENKGFIRIEAAKKAGLKVASGLPLIYNDEIIGVLILGFNKDEKPENAFTTLLDMFGAHFGAEIKRKQLEEELNQIFLFTPDILCIANIDGYFKKVNPAMSILLEYTEEELLSRPFMEFVHPLDKEKTLTELGNIVQGKPTYYIENRYITKSGKTKWLAWTTTDASEQGVLYCAAKDITEKNELEELLNKATVLARIGGWEVDVVKQTVYWSNITREIHEADPGYQPDIDSVIDFYKKGEDRETIVKKLEDAVTYGTPGDAELQIITTRGNTKWVRVIVEAEFADEKCLRVYGSIQDIDARKKAEISGTQALEERNTILESIDDAFFAVDKNWVVTYWNNTAEKVLGTPKNKILNNNLWEIFSDSIDSVSYKKYHEAFGTNQAVHFEDYYQPVKKWYEISAYPSNTGLSVYFKDVTERKTSEMQLQQLNEALQKHAKELAISNAELEQFAYVASHDLQEPLRMVTSFLTQLDKKYGTIIDDKGKQYIHFAVDGAKRMRQIILDLLDFSRVGRVEDDIEGVDFNKLINEILALYRRSIEELRANILFENLPVISTYKTPVRQVFQNLISNSLKYHRKNEPPTIVIACKESKTQYQFSIKDNGIGIAPEYFDKVFIIFQRLHNKDEYSGTGMGLAIAKKIIENMGGKIWIESEEGKGSTFYFTLLKTNKI
jgi:PAS domain S-box-containing protein